MRYFPHALSFTFFFLTGLAFAGAFSFVALIKWMGASLCFAICLLVIEAAVMKRAVKPPVEMEFRYVTAVAQTLLRKGDVCTVDIRDRTIERASS